MAKNRKLGRPTDQRLSILRNQATDLIMYGKIETTKHPGFGRAEERDREKGCEDVGVLLEMREGG